MLLQCYKQLCRYHTTLPFFEIEEHDKGSITTIVIEFSNMSEIVNVKIAQLRIPITLLSVHNVEEHVYHIMSGNWIYYFLKLSKPIFVMHRDCTRPIKTPTTFSTI